jgi:hypothetical protein
LIVIGNTAALTERSPLKPSNNQFSEIRIGRVPVPKATNIGCPMRRGVFKVSWQTPNTSSVERPRRETLRRTTDQYVVPDIIMFKPALNCWFKSSQVDDVSPDQTAAPNRCDPAHDALASITLS